MGLFGGDSGLIGGVMGGLFGGKTGAEKDLQALSKAYYGGSLLQRMLPVALRTKTTDPMLAKGMENISNLLNNPGGLSPTVSDAIRPQLAMESQSIGQNFQNLQQQNAGNAARGNAPVSIKNALASALDVGQERSQRETRLNALMQSGKLQRQDAEQVYKLLDIILQFMSSGRGQGIQGMASASQVGQKRQADQMSFVSDMIGGMMGGGVI
jgi:hypothetical protein